MWLYIVKTRISGAISPSEIAILGSRGRRTFIDADGDGKDYLELQVTPKNVVFDRSLSAIAAISRSPSWDMKNLELVSTLWVR